MTSPPRRALGAVIFVIGTALCGWWAYRNLQPLMPFLRESAGSGGIGAVSAGFVDVAGVPLLLSPVLTFVLTARARAGRRGTILRWAHIATTIALIALAVFGDVRVSLIVLVLFFPLQAFFLITAIALRVSVIST